MIDLRSDTVTKPTQAMRDVMSVAEVGDDIFGEDPSINALQEHAADMFGKEGALYCPSGTQTNQIAIKVHTVPGDEVICSRLSHIYLYEGGGIAMNSGASVRLIDGNQGRFTARDVEVNINADDQHHPTSSLVSLEDTCNKGGGSIWDMSDIKAISELCRPKGIGVHLDGARLFNSLVETNVDPKEYGSHFDSISICLSKGLGAPVGSLLLGDSAFIAKARRVRKVFGGAMRQAGIIASAGLFALKNNIERLKEDNANAKRIESVLSSLAYVVKVLPVATNIVMFEMKDEQACKLFIDRLQSKDIHAFAIGGKKIRFVFHMEVTAHKLDTLEQALKEISI